MTEWGSRIKLAVRRPGYTQAGLAKACKIAPPSVSDWITGETKMIEGMNLVRAAAYLETSAEWIMTGRPDPKRPAASSQPARLDLETMAEAMLLLGMVADVKGWKRPENVNSSALAVVYELLVEDASESSKSNVVDFMKRFNARLEEREKADGSRRKKAARASA